MIDVVTPELRPMYTDQLEQMFRQRYKVFVEQLEWDLPAKGAHDRLEKDQFDLSDTIYLLLTGSGGRLLSSVRLNPSTSPHLAQGIFREAIDADLPCDPKTWEMSRYYALPEQPGWDEVNRMCDLVHIGIIETALLFGIDRMLFQAPTKWLGQADKRGLDWTTLGRPFYFNGDLESYSAGMLYVSVECLDRMRSLHGVPRPLIRFHSLDQAA